MKVKNGFWSVKTFGQYKWHEHTVQLPQLDIPTIIRTPTAVYETRLIEKDINGVEYKYENKDELAFGTTYEGEDMNQTNKRYAINTTIRTIKGNQLWQKKQMKY